MPVVSLDPAKIIALLNFATPIEVILSICDKFSIDLSPPHLVEGPGGFCRFCDARRVTKGKVKLLGTIIPFGEASLGLPLCGRRIIAILIIQVLGMIGTANKRTAGNLFEAHP